MYDIVQADATLHVGCKEVQDYTEFGIIEFCLFLNNSFLNHLIIIYFLLREAYTVW